MAEEIVEKLYEAYRSELIRWCRGMTGDVQTAEELVQEAFLRALLHSGLLEKLEECQRRSWLYRTTKNLYVDHVRRRRCETAASASAEQEMATASAVSATSEEISLMEWEEILESLPDMEGLMFSLRYLQGYTSGQIGKMLGMPAGTVRARLSEARKHLRRLTCEGAERKEESSKKAMRRK